MSKNKKNTKRAKKTANEEVPIFDPSEQYFEPVSFVDEDVYTESYNEKDVSPPTFDVGEVVQLNSGGQVMTVKDASDPNNVECVFFTSTSAFANQLSHEYFDSRMLKRSPTHVGTEW